MSSDSEDKNKISIQFVREYAVDTRYSEILNDFLMTLSDAYGYRIDVHDVGASTSIDNMQHIADIFDVVAQGSKMMQRMGSHCAMTSHLAARDEAKSNRAAAARLKTLRDLVASGALDLQQDKGDK